MIQELYTDPACSVLVNNVISDPFLVNTGVLQGDTLSPFLFIFVME